MKCKIEIIYQSYEHYDVVKISDGDGFDNKIMSHLIMEILSYIN